LAPICLREIENRLAATLCSNLRDNAAPSGVSQREIVSHAPQRRVIGHPGQCCDPRIQEALGLRRSRAISAFIPQKRSRLLSTVPMRRLIVKSHFPYQLIRSNSLSALCTR
jgi:hypothetical protein